MAAPFLGARCQANTITSHIKVFLPSKIRAEALSFLDSANINHMSLFPDLYGVAKYTNAKIANHDIANESEVLYESLKSLF